MLIKYDDLDKKLDLFLKEMAFRRLKNKTKYRDLLNYNGFNIDWNLMISKARKKRENNKNTDL